MSAELKVGECPARLFIGGKDIACHRQGKTEEERAMLHADGKHEAMVDDSAGSAGIGGKIHVWWGYIRKVKPPII